MDDLAPSGSTPSPVLPSGTEASANIARWLVKHEYSDDDVAKVLGGNILRVLKEVWWK